MILLDTGIRADELCKLTISDVAQQSGKIMVRRGKGGNLLALQQLLGHSSLEMVRRYAAIAEADLERAHETGSPADQ